MKMAAKFDNDWQAILAPEFEKDYYLKLRQTLKSEYMTKTIFPKSTEIFNAMHFTAYSDIKAVIIGQDPYHGAGQAHGLCFSVSPDIKMPPSLVNIYKEMNTDIGANIPNNGYLKKWAQQGVLLLNAVLTVSAHKAASHRGIGWEQFTDHIISLINAREKPVVFILWGSFAGSKEKLITHDRHLIIKSPHPSPLSAYRGFFGSKPFSKTNDFLAENGMDIIDWQIDNI
jgi:uracil-DNA glycosylase